MIVRFIPFVFFVLLSASAQADGPCDYFKSNSPALYEAYCKNGSSSGRSRSKPAGASTTFSSSFNINTAAIPNEKSPYGLETIGSTVDGRWGEQFALIKGFSKFGAGISTSSANSFYANDIYQRLYKTPTVQDFQPNETPKGGPMNLNLGTSFALMRIGKYAKISVGLSARYNKITNGFGGGPAVLVNSPFISFGTGYTNERVSNRLPRVNFRSYTVSARVFLLELQYDQLRDDLGIGLSPIHIGTATVSFHRMIVSLAARKLNYTSAGEIYQYHQAIQFLLTKHISLGLMHNFIPGTYSVGFQYFL